MDRARRIAEDAARRSYGRLVAYLAAQFRDIAQAEDAVSEAFRLALETWGKRGIPDNPEAWLATVARRQILDAKRKSGRAMASVPLLEMIAEERGDNTSSAALSPIPDARLKLIFACAHPAVDRSMHAPLILQTILGFDAAAIASAFLVSPTTMGQRLVRVKRKIAASGIAFSEPQPEDLPERLGSVLDAIYAAFGLAWNDPSSEDARDMSQEAIWLAGLVSALLYDNREAQGLLALMLFSHARRDTRRAADGAFVPLDEQDPRDWDHAMIDAALAAFRVAVSGGPLGRYALEAAIQSAHAGRLFTGNTDWHDVAGVYNKLWDQHPSIGVFVGRAAAHGEVYGPNAGLALLDDAPEDRTRSYQPYWAVRADLLVKSGDLAGARVAFTKAIGLCDDAAVRAYLISRVPGP